jgi:hypothetical protein
MEKKQTRRPAGTETLSQAHFFQRFARAPQPPATTLVPPRWSTPNDREQANLTLENPRDTIRVRIVGPDLIDWGGRQTRRGGRGMQCELLATYFSTFLHELNF